MRGGTRKERQELIEIPLQARHRARRRRAPAVRPPTEDPASGALARGLVDRLRLRETGRVKPPGQLHPYVAEFVSPRCRGTKG